MGSRHGDTKITDIFVTFSLTTVGRFRIMRDSRLGAQIGSYFGV